MSDGETFDLEVVKLDYLVQSLSERLVVGGAITETLIAV
jgi:hypothetical protein